MNRIKTALGIWAFAVAPAIVFTALFTGFGDDSIPDYSWIRPLAGFAVIILPVATIPFFIFPDDGKVVPLSNPGEAQSNPWIGLLKIVLFWLAFYCLLFSIGFIWEHCAAWREFLNTHIFNNVTHG